MNLRSHNSMDRTGTGEDTLRLLAGLPAPEGLESRVHASLRNAPRQARVLAWPLVLRADAAWVRATAAAAIVMVVAGGGWGIYSKVQPLQQGKLPAVPARVSAPSGFSGAGMVSTPKTIEGPVVTAPPKTTPAKSVQKKSRKRSAASSVRTTPAAPASK